MFIKAKFFKENVLFSKGRISEMNHVVALLLLVKFASAIPYHYNYNNYYNYNQINHDDHHAFITKFDANTDEHGYSYSVETSNGIQQNESANLVNPGTDNEILSVRGSYSYMAPDGNSYMVEYTADENGFQPAGAHIPQSAGVRRLGVPSAALASLAGGGLG